VALAGLGALEQAVQNRAMIDDTTDIQITQAATAAHPAAPGPDVRASDVKGPEASTAELASTDAGQSPTKKRSRSGAKGTKGKGAEKGGEKTAAKAAAAAIEARIGHRFADPSLLVTAFTHVSALKSTKKRGDSYQRLEFLGDHVLGLIVSDMLYRAFPSADEGELSKRLADLVRKESCADVAKSLGLLDDIKLGAVGAGAGARLRKSVLGDVCEAVIGAVFLDGGYQAAAGFVERNWTERMHKPRRPLRDPKTVLQEWAQGKGLPTPVYREVERTGPHHDPQFRVAVDLPGLEPAEGVGGSKRAAEKVAASVMIEREGVGGGSNDG
jgi:ribonuclease III